MIPDFPMPPGLHGIIDIEDDGSSSRNNSCNFGRKIQTFHTFEKFYLPEEIGDYGLNDPLPYTPTITQFLDLEEPSNKVLPPFVKFSKPQPLTPIIKPSIPIPKLYRQKRHIRNRNFLME